MRNSGQKSFPQHSRNRAKCDALRPGIRPLEVSNLKSNLVAKKGALG